MKAYSTPTTNRPSDEGIAEFLNWRPTRNKRSVGPPKCHTTGDVGQEPIHGISELGTHRASQIQLVVDSGTWNGSAEEEALSKAIDAGPSNIGVNAHHDVVGQLVVVPRIDTTQPAIDISRG